MPDPFERLKEDHRAVEALFEQFDQTQDHKVAVDICAALTSHATVEEELVYPLYRAKVGTEGADEARQEHQEMKDLIAVISTMDSDSSDLASTVEKLRAAHTHHVQEEESEFFPELANRVPELVDGLEKSIAARRDALQEEMEFDRSTGLNPHASGQKAVITPDQPLGRTAGPPS